ncbi:hypothetical protein CI102_14219 [Trichoderma harzianum]|nr:hypothetical protein CI102_14219 [Trichoderma harzianum]
MRTSLAMYPRFYKADTIQLGRHYIWPDDRKREFSRSTEPRRYYLGIPRTSRELELLLGNAKKNTRVSEEDDPEAILECTREEWELSTQIPLKEEQLSGEKAATPTTIRSTKGEEEEYSGFSEDPKAIQPPPEYKGDEITDAGLFIQKENDSTERVLQEEEEEGSTHGSDTDATEILSESDRDKWFKYRKFTCASERQMRSLDDDRNRKRSLDDNSERERKKQRIS